MSPMGQPQMVGQPQMMGAVARSRFTVCRCDAHGTARAQRAPYGCCCRRRHRRGPFESRRGLCARPRRCYGEACAERRLLNARPTGQRGSRCCIVKFNVSAGAPAAAGAEQLYGDACCRRGAEGCSCPASSELLLFLCCRRARSATFRAGDARRGVAPSAAPCAGASSRHAAGRARRAVQAARPRACPCTEDVPCALAWCGIMCCCACIARVLLIITRPFADKHKRVPRVQRISLQALTTSIATRCPSASRCAAQCRRDGPR